MSMLKNHYVNIYVYGFFVCLFVFKQICFVFFLVTSCLLSLEVK